MLSVKTPEEVYRILEAAFPARAERETVALGAAAGRVLFEDMAASEYVPDFNRSTVDGYAVRGADTFGCSDAIPALLTLSGEIRMGHEAGMTLASGCCAAVPTGGEVPAGADAVVMVEDTEAYGDGSVGVTRPAAPGCNLIYRGDDVSPGNLVLPAGRRLTAADIGALAAMGVTEVSVCRRLRVGILSTGDELVPADACPGRGQVRDVNSAMLAALAQEAGAIARCCGIVRDEEALLGAAVDAALQSCDVLLLSGGSSVGVKDAAQRVLEARGELLFHGIAMKPGKPTMLARVDAKPVWGLPGHPAAAFFVACLFLPPTLAQLTGRTLRRFTVPAVLTEAMSANHGRAQYSGVRLYREGSVLRAQPIHGKSGLITALAGADGFFCIPRDCEGAAAGETVQITLCAAD